MLDEPEALATRRWVSVTARERVPAIRATGMLRARLARARISWDRTRVREARDWSEAMSASEHVVILGGAAGCATAYYLAGRGSGSTIVERGGVGSRGVGVVGGRD